MGSKFWEETLSENHRNSKNPLTLWELPLALTTSYSYSIPACKKIEDKNFVKNSLNSNQLMKHLCLKSLINLMLKKQQVLIKSLSNLLNLVKYHSYHQSQK